MVSEKKTVLITGATSGLGYGFAKKFAEDGYRLVLVARNKEKLEEMAREFKREYDVFVKIMVADLSRAKAAKEIFDSLQGSNIEIEVLVNNAGFGGFGKFWERELQEELEMIRVNVTSLVSLTRLFLPKMIEAGEGKILNVASMAGFLSGPFMATYYASKNFVLSFSEALAEELRGTGVTLTILCPGPVKTGFQERAVMNDSSLTKGNIMSIEAVVDAGYEGLRLGKRIVIPGRRNQLSAVLPRLLPRSWMTRMVKQVQKNKLI